MQGCAFSLSPQFVGRREAAEFIDHGLCPGQRLVLKPGAQQTDLNSKGPSWSLSPRRGSSAVASASIAGARSDRPLIAAIVVAECNRIRASSGPRLSSVRPKFAALARTSFARSLGGRLSPLVIRR